MTKPVVFVREATGLVRQVSATGSFGVSIAGIGVITPYLFYQGFMMSAPGASPILAIVVMIVPFMALAAVWALLGMAFPRSGGDYVFNSRLIHPTIGLMVDFTGITSISTGFPVYAIVTVGLISDLFAIEGFVLGNQSLTSLSLALSNVNVEFVIASAMCLITMLALIGRTRILTRVAGVAAVLSILCVLVVSGITASTSNVAYQALFNNFYHVEYNSIVQEATTQGFTFAPWVGTSLFGASSLLFWLVGTGQAAHIGGETKQPSRTFLYSILAGEAIMIGLFLLVGLVSFPTFGFNFSYAIDYLASVGKLPLPGKQFYGLGGGGTFLDLIAPILANPILIAAVYLIIAFQAFFSGSLMMLHTSRKLFAWSFDRLLPSKFSEVSERFKTPIYCAIPIAVIVEIITVAFLYGPGIFAIIGGVGALMAAIEWGFSALCGILIVTKRDYLRQAPALVQKKIVGIPIIAILGLTALVTILGVVIVGQLVPAIQGGLPVTATVWTVGLFLAGLPYYLIVKAYRRKHDGIDLSLAFKQIPPE